MNNVEIDLLDAGYARLLRRFPALYQLTIWHKGKLIFQRTNPAARERIGSRVFRNLLQFWGKAFSAPPETFRHQIAGRSNIRLATKSIVALLVGVALRDGLSLSDLFGRRRGRAKASVDSRVRLGSVRGCGDRFCRRTRDRVEPVY